MDNYREQEDEIIIDFGQLFRMMKQRLLWIILIAVIGALAAYLISTFVMVKQYSSESTIYITPETTEQGTIEYSDMQTNSMLVNNYMEILQGRTILSKVSENLELNDVALVQDSLSLSNKEETEIISITSTTDDPQLSCDIVQQTVDVFAKEMKDILGIENITILNEAEVNEVPVSPNVKRNTLLGGAAGAALVVGIICLQYVLDRRLRNREAVEAYLGIPVLTTIPLQEMKHGAH